MRVETNTQPAEGIPSPTEPSTREVVGVFIDTDKLEGAARELLEAGFARADISLLADEKNILSGVLERAPGARASMKERDFAKSVKEYVRGESVGDAVHGIFGGLLFAGVVATGSFVIASAGVLGGAVAAAIAGTATTGAIGATLATLIDKSDAEYFEEQLERGRLLLFVRVRDAAEEQRAQNTLTTRSAFDTRVVHIPPATTA